MSYSSNDSSWGRRKSLFALSLTHIHDSSDQSTSKPRFLKKRRPSVPTEPARIDHPDIPYSTGPSPTAESPKLSRPSLRGSMRRTPSMFGSLRSSTTRSSRDAYDYLEEPLSATPSITQSQGDASFDAISLGTTILHHGEVQTSAGLLRKRKEYIVVTEVAIHRFKSQSKASEVFINIKNPFQKHGHIQSFGSQSDFGSLGESSGERDGRIPLRQVVAIRSLDDGKSSFAIEVAHLDEECANNASILNLQCSNAEERGAWLQHLRAAANEARLKDEMHVSPTNVEYVARVMERDRDYDPSNCAIFKAVHAKTAGRSSSDDISKFSSAVCFLAIGVHKIHIIPPMKAGGRLSSPPLTNSSIHTSHGILTLTSLKVASNDDSFELSFRQPLKQSKTCYLSSSASQEIADRIHFAEMFLRPERPPSMYKFRAAKALENPLLPPAPFDAEEHRCLDRTLSAYCVAYAVNPANIRYSISYECEDAPEFQLLSPSDARRKTYAPLELLAILRALRFNESFGSISFAGVQLDGLNGLHDPFSRAHSSSRGDNEQHPKATNENFTRPCLLVQELRGLATGSRRLRRLDFSGCISFDGTPAATSIVEDESSKSRDPGCGVAEAVFPLCKQQKTNVDWICLNGINLSDTDLDYLVSAAVDRSCHFRAVELNRCGLTDRTLGLVLDALRAQESTLEALKIAGNPARLNPASFDTQIGMFGFIRKLDLSWTNRNSGQEPLLTAETLQIWRLQELRFSGTSLNPTMIDVVATYLANPQSETLHELAVDQTYLTGCDIATLLQSMTREAGHSRDLHLDISQARINKDIDKLTQAIAGGYAPIRLTMRAIEYREESMFRKVLAAVTVNKTIQFLDMSQTALPGDASDETCKALERLLSENDTLVAFDLSGEDSRLATSKIGSGINDALAGLKQNKTLRRFRIERQKLGLQGASTLADVLKCNKALQELHCDNNEIPLQGLTDLVNSLAENTSILFLPSMNDGRTAAFHAAEATMKAMTSAELTHDRSAQQPSSVGVQRKLTNARRNVAKAASAYTSSLPAITSMTRANAPPGLITPPGPFSLARQGSKLRRGSQMVATNTPTTFTVQDIQNTHRLLSEQWDRQCERLAQYLERNWCLFHNLPIEMEQLTDKSERPESLGSITNMLQQVKYDTTPKAERPLYFDSNTIEETEVRCSTSGSDGDSNTPETPEERRPQFLRGKSSAMSFKQFLIGSDSASLNDFDEDDAEIGARTVAVSRFSAHGGDSLVD